MLLNKAGMATLAQSVLASMPSYCMQHVWVPQGVCDQVDNEVKRFLSQGADNRDIHLVK